MSSSFKSLASYSDITRVLRRHWRRTAVLFFGFMGLFMLALIVWPRKYESEGKLFVRQTVKHIAEDPSATKGQSVVLQESRNFEINSIAEMLASQALAEKVTDAIGAEVILDESKDDDARAQFERATRKLKASIEVETPRESTVIDIRYKAATPELSQQIVETLMNEYLEEHARVNRTDGSYDFFVEQTDLLKTKLRQANAELRDAKDRMQVVSIIGKQNSLQQQIHAIEMEIISTNRELATSQARIAALTRSINILPERVMTEEISGIASQASDSMRNELYKLQAEEQGLIAKYTDDYPKVVAVRKQIAELQEIFGDEEKQISHHTTAMNLNRQQLELALLTEQASLETAEMRAVKLEEQHNTMLAKLNALNAAEVQLAELQTNANICKTNYEAYADKLEQSRMHHAMETDRISNVKIAQNASLQHKPVSPRKGIVLALGFFISVVSSVAIALLLESQDSSLKSREEIEEQLSLPVLISIPRISSQRAELN